MTTAQTPPNTKEELNTELRALLFTAYENGVDVEGGFDCRNGAEQPDWDVIVTEFETNG